MRRLGSPAIRVVMMMPMTPICSASAMARGKPIAAVSRLSLRLRAVLPSPFMKLPALRLPSAVYT